MDNHVEAATLVGGPMDRKVLLVLKGRDEIKFPRLEGAFDRPARYDVYRRKHGYVFTYHGKEGGGTVNDFEKLEAAANGNYACYGVGLSQEEALRLVAEYKKADAARRHVERLRKVCTRNVREHNELRRRLTQTEDLASNRGRERDTAAAENKKLREEIAVLKRTLAARQLGYDGQWYKRFLEANKNANLLLDAVEKLANGLSEGAVDLRSAVKKTRKELDTIR